MEDVSAVEPVEQLRGGQLHRLDVRERPGGESHDGDIVLARVGIEARMHDRHPTPPGRDRQREREVVGEEAGPQHWRRRRAGRRDHHPLDVRGNRRHAVRRRQEQPITDHRAAAQEGRRHRAPAVDVESEEPDSGMAVAVRHALVDGLRGSREGQEQQRDEQGGELHGRPPRSRRVTVDPCRIQGLYEPARAPVGSPRRARVRRPRAVGGPCATACRSTSAGRGSARSSPSLLDPANEPVGADALDAGAVGRRGARRRPPRRCRSPSRGCAARSGRPPTGWRPSGGGYRLIVEPGELDARALRSASADASRSGAGPRWPTCATRRRCSRRSGASRSCARQRSRSASQADLDRGEHARLVGELDGARRRAPAARAPARPADARALPRRPPRRRARRLPGRPRRARRARARARARAARARAGDPHARPGARRPGARRPSHRRRRRRRSAATTTCAPSLALLDDARLRHAHRPRRRRQDAAGDRGRARRRRPLRLRSPRPPTPSGSRPSICDALGGRARPGESDAEALDRALGTRAAAARRSTTSSTSRAPRRCSPRCSNAAPALTILARAAQPLRIRAERLYPVAPLARDDARRAVRRPRPRPRPRVRAHDETRRRRRDLPAASTGCRSRSSSPRHGSACSARRRSPSASTTRWPARPRPAATPRSASARCAPRSTGASTCSTTRERDAFAALGAFAGGCELDAAEAVTGARSRCSRGSWPRAS